MANDTIQLGKELALTTAVVTVATAILGIRGSGKTNTGVCIAEDLLEAGQQVIIVDPLDVWWGLKSSADGKQEGYAITVVGGAHGDIPLTETDGKTIADFLVDHPVPAILSLRHLRKEAQRRFLTDFAEQLFHRKGESSRKTPVLCVIDEASRFVPQRVMGEDARLVGAINDWVRLGRSSGIGAMLIDQRAASINKDVLTQIELMVAHRVTSPQDRKALQEWVQANASDEQNKVFLATLADLTKGEAWFWSPEWLKVFTRAQVRVRRTFDSSATPKLGDKQAVPKKLASVQLDALRTKLAATIEKAKADDPKELRRQIGELTKQLAAASKVPPAKVETKTIDRPVVTDKQIAALEKLVVKLEQQSKAHDARIEKVRTIVEPMVKEFAEGRGSSRDLVFLVQDAIFRARALNTTAVPGVVSRSVEKREAVQARRPLSDWGDGKYDDGQTYSEEFPPEAKGGTGVGDPAVTGGLRRVMTALAQRNGLTNKQLGCRAGIPISSSTFRAHLAKARAAGWIEDRGDTRHLTTAGVVALGEYVPLPTGPALLAYWLRELGGGEAKVLQAIVSAHPVATSYDDISAVTGTPVSSSTFRAHLAKLRKLELVSGGAQGVTASPELFQ